MLRRHAALFVWLLFGASLGFLACASKSSGFPVVDAALPPVDDADILPNGPSCSLAGDAGLGGLGCVACATGSCCAEGNQCLGDPECVAILACVAQCPLDAGSTAVDAGDDGGGDDDAGSGDDCGDSCRQAHRTAIGEYAAFTMCIEMGCGPSLCPGF